MCVFNNPHPMRKRKPGKHDFIQATSHLQSFYAMSHIWIEE